MGGMDEFVDMAGTAKEKGLTRVRFGKRVNAFINEIEADAEAIKADYVNEVSDLVTDEAIRTNFVVSISDDAVIEERKFLTGAREMVEAIKEIKKKLPVNNIKEL